MRVLVLTDFSESAEKAARFALTFAEQLRAELLLLHVLPDLGPTIGRHRTEEIVREMHLAAEHEMQDLRKRLSQSGINVSATTAFATSIYAAMEAVAETNAIDFAIMSTKGASGVKRALLGSNAVDVINHSHIPIILVPEHGSVAQVKTLVYASDFTNLRQEIKMLVPIARKLCAGISVLNLPPPYYREYLDGSRLINDIRSEMNFPDISLKLLEGENPIQLLEDYVLSSRGELLTMFTHHVSFADQLFRRSITREIAWHSKIPLLVFHKSVNE